MKIRMQHNSIRFRLKGPEVESFQRVGNITETIQFGNGEQLQFLLERSNVNKVTVKYLGGTTVVSVPETTAEQWTSTDQVGFEAVIDIGNGKILKLLVEKDFECIDAPAEENVGCYPNPAKQSLL